MSGKDPHVDYFIIVSIAGRQVASRYRGMEKLTDLNEVSEVSVDVLQLLNAKRARSELKHAGAF